MPTQTQDARSLNLLVLSSIFLLNDLLFIRTTDYVTWLIIDYGSRVLAVGIMAYLILTKRTTPAEFGLAPIALGAGVRWTLLLTVTGILIDQAGWRFFEAVLPDTRLASMPRIGDPLVNFFDLTFGVALVALSEELVFRGYCHTALHDRFRPGPLVAASSVLFGLIHWSTGLHAIVTTALWGVLPMAAMLRTRTVLPAMIAHYLTDLVSLGGFLPGAWLEFLNRM